MKKANKSILVIVLAIMFAVSLTGLGSFLSGKNASSKTTRELATSCTLDMYTQFHIHPHLTIRIDGVQQTIPTNTGITLACMHPLHTHDESGTIHVESPEQRDFTLGDFFAVWGQTFNRDQILDHKADANHEIVMTVDGQPSTEFENLVLKDQQQIVIEYKTIGSATSTKQQ